jgi:exopolysaccharide biosynthesis protein
MFHVKRHQDNRDLDRDRQEPWNQSSQSNFPQIIQHLEPAKQIRSSLRRIPVVAALAIDLVVAAFILLVFCLFYFILPREIKGETEFLPTSSLTTSSSTKVTQTSASTSESSQSETTTSVTSQTTATQFMGQWYDKFTEHFTSGPIEKTSSSYRSSHISIKIEKVQENGVTYFLADIYLADIQYFRSAFAKDKYGKGFHDTTDEIARQKNAVLAINGDYYSNNAGPVVRNGVLYRDEIYKDALVMFNDGQMATFTATEFNIDQIRSSGAYQVWTFGPMLLKDGQPMTTFNSSVTPLNPRTAVGYYEPGHYCFVVVDGRQPGYSNGLSMKQLSQLFYKLGCKVAFNLDGGQSSEMAFMGQLANMPYHGGRETSDVVMIIDEIE